MQKKKTVVKDFSLYHKYSTNIFRKCLNHSSKNVTALMGWDSHSFQRMPVFRPMINLSKCDAHYNPFHICTYAFHNFFLQGNQVQNIRVHAHRCTFCGWALLVRQADTNFDYKNSSTTKMDNGQMKNSRGGFPVSLQAANGTFAHTYSPINLTVPYARLSMWSKRN